ncbi:MAG TPA: hypothetical protein PLJ71_22415 [Candidatus Hydrogenedentes bacterium]|nr:hypothetical protein [Candidatus Hydrogenedentota bacterium]HQM51443.1 hypothetical protein [Candidatus Hydrogenedentota bacterium]
MKPRVLASVAVVILVVLTLPVILVKMAGSRDEQAGPGNGLQQEYGRIRAEGQPITL